MERKEHWEQVYESSEADRLGWYKPHLQTSLAWLDALQLDRDAEILDVGGGASTFVDDLLDRGYRSITVVDIAAPALSVVKARLGDRAAQVAWVTGDITEVELPRDHFDLWHDRAVFHFLTEPDEQQRYRETVLRVLKPSGALVIGTFALEAPPSCSGLRVQRYSRESLIDVLGAEFELQRDHKELHVTPGGVEQMYLYCQFRRTP